MPSNLNKIEEIEDLKECVDVMNAFGLPTKGFNRMDEMKAALCKHLKDLEGTSTRKVGEVSTKPPIFFLKKQTQISWQLIVVILLSKCCVVR